MSSARYAPPQQTSASNPQGPSRTPPAPKVAAAQDAILAHGEPLDAASRALMEPRFGHDFSRVRVHHDGRSAAAARGIDALAYTLGDHLVFAAGAYAPATARGQRTLAHELAHVVQQRNAAHEPSAEPTLAEPHDRHEREAHDASEQVLRGGNPAGALSAMPVGDVRIQRLRPDEMVDPTNPGAGDKFDAQTAKASPSKIKYKLRGTVVSVPKELGIFVPSNIGSENRVHLFFTPYVAAENGVPAPMAALSYVAEQGLRAQAEHGGWILIAVPALEEGDKPYVTVSTSDIQACLAVVHRPEPDKIKSIKLSAHSRGYRGLAHTMGWTAGGPAEIDLSKVVGVSVFDASYEDLGKTLKSHVKDLPKLQDKSDPTKFDKDAVRLYDVTVANVSGLPGIDLRDPLAVQGLAYMRFAKDAIQRGLLHPSEFAPPSSSDHDPKPPADVRAATTRLLAKMPWRGGFVTAHPKNFLSWVPGQQDIQTFIKDNRDDLRLVGREKNGLKAFLLDIGVNAGDQPWGNDAHHWLATELSHEATDFTDFTQ